MSTLFNTIIYANALPFICLSGFLYFVKTNPLFDKKQTSLFVKAIIVYLLMIIVISLDYLFARTSAPNIYIYRSITTFLNFAISPIIPILLYKIFYKKKSSIWFYLSFIINAIISFLSIFKGYIFNIGTNNSYDRGPLFFLPFITSVIYILVLALIQRKHYTKAKKVERTYLFIVIGLLIIAMYFEIIFRFLFLTWDYSAMSLIIYYLMLNIHHSILDPLTGAYNRVRYSKELELIDNKKSCVIAILDINDFKNINDTYGHEAGDQCLITFVDILEKQLSSMATIFRIGGDEFTVIAHKEKMEKVETAINKAQLEANNNAIYFSYGIKEYYPNEHISTFLNDVDKLMYEHKKLDKEKGN